MRKHITSHANLSQYHADVTKDTDTFGVELTKDTDTIRGDLSKDTDDSGPIKANCAIKT